MPQVTGSSAMTGLLDIRVALRQNKVCEKVAYDDPELVATRASLRRHSLPMMRDPGWASTQDAPDVMELDDDDKIYIMNGTGHYAINSRPGLAIRYNQSCQAAEVPNTLTLSETWMSISAVTTNGIFVCPLSARDVELVGGSCFRVSHVLFSEERDTVVLCGYYFRRIAEEPICSMLSRTRHDTHPEYCQMVQDGRQVYIIPAEQVSRHCRIALTNSDWEQRLGVFDDSPHGWPTVFCRYKFNSFSVGRPRTGSLVLLTQEQADPQWSVSDENKRTKWRGTKTRLGGSATGIRQSELKAIKEEELLSIGARSGHAYDLWCTEDHQTHGTLPSQELRTDTIDLTADDLPMRDYGRSATAEHAISIGPQSSQTDPFWRRTSRRQRQDELRCPHIQRYTAADGFCGGGGTTRGMREAGIAVVTSFDFDREACRAYCLNNPSTLVAENSVQKFIGDSMYHSIVDILHLSPPCQFFSPAHTHEGRNDEANSAASFSISGMLNAMKPRIVTLEQTEGIISRHEAYFHALINQFTAEGYSVRWKVLHMADYGVPQTRQRLIIIASCPGEQLPDFPEPNHSKNPATQGGRPYHTVNDAIRGIPANWPDHNPRELLSRQRLGNKALLAFDGETQMAKTITTSGGDNNNHPSGQRRYTLRELAAIQSFPLWHRFPSDLPVTRLTKIVGNAVPPLFAKRLYESILAHLERVDGVAR